MLTNKILESLIKVTPLIVKLTQIVTLFDLTRILTIEGFDRGSQKFENYEEFRKIRKLQKKGKASNSFLHKTIFQK